MQPAAPAHPRRNRRALVACLCALGLSTTATWTDTAEAKPAPAKKGKVDKNVLAAQALLASNDRDQVEAGIQSLGLIGTAAAAPPIIERVRAGLPPDLLETSIITLMALGQPQAGPLYLELLEHRRPEVRVRAIEAIVALKPKDAEPGLQRALADLDPKVRSAAATALGELRASASIEQLFLALDRGTFEASNAIGHALRTDHVPRLLSYLGTLPFHHLQPAFTQVMQRKDIAEKDKLSVVSRLQEVGTREVKDYFGDLVRESGEQLAEPVRRAVLRAMQEIAD
jgi:HEAT repeat protein